MFNTARKDFHSISLLVCAELAAIFFMVSLAPTKTGILLLDALILGGVIFLRFDRALLFSIVNIPFYPIIPGMGESFSTWRVVVLILLMRLAYEQKDAMVAYLKNISFGTLKNDFLRLSFFSKALIFFFAVAGISAVNAPYITAAAKQLAFFVNVCALGYIVYNYVQTRTKFLNILFACLAAVAEVIAIGLFQFYIVGNWTLYYFWQFWAERVIPVFYGENLAHLLSYSNTWFSYFEDSSAGLRMFSVFPDSHSFAIFLILGLSYALFLLFESISRKNGLWKKIGLVALILLSIALSGSRGAWVSILVPAAVFLSWYVFKTRDKRIPVFACSIIAAFILLFPLSSALVSFSQRNEFGPKAGGKSFMFKRALSIVDTDERSNKGRLEIWHDTAFFMKENFLLGVGPGNYPVVLKEDIASAKQGASAHNIYLNVLAETGVFGLIFFLSVIFGMLVVIYELAFEVKRSEYRIFAYMYALSFLWALGYGLFDVVLFNDKVLLLFAVQTGVLFALHRKTGIHSVRNFHDKQSIARA